MIGMKRAKNVAASGLGLLVVVLLGGCGGGGGGGGGGGEPAPGGGTPSTGAGALTFSGGTLEDLKTLSANLQFDRLVIAGPLSLPIADSSTISANSLTLTPEGKVEYSYGTCEYRAAPGITFTVANDIVIDGEISLSGRSGTSVTSGASCNSCTGQNGGDIAITADTIKITSKISNSGGDGASSRSAGFPSSPCASGQSGNLTLAARTAMDLSGANIENRAGRNFAGTAAASGAADISAGGAFTMVKGEIASTGAMTFTAASTDIWGVIRYGSLTETIGGLPDTVAPTVMVLNPPANAALTAGQTVDVTVQASDVGMGIKDVQVQGLGLDETRFSTDFVGSAVTVPLAVGDVPVPAKIDVTVTDNKGNAQTVTVTGLSIEIPTETEPNDSLAQAQALNQGGAIRGTVQNGNVGTTYTTPPTGLHQNSSGVFKVEDFYRVVCCKASGISHQISISLDFSTGAAGRPDIDVYLFNSAGTQVIASGIDDNVQLNRYTESIVQSFTAADVGQTFYVGIQAWNVPVATTYKVKY